MKNDLRAGNIVHYFSKNANGWFNFHALSQNDIDCILSGVDKYEGVDLSDDWRDYFLHESKERMIPSDIKYLHELQNHYFNLSGRELIKSRQSSLVFAVPAIELSLNFLVGSLKAIL